MIALFEAERRAAGSRALVILGAVCVLSGFLAWNIYENKPNSTRSPALALYVPPSGYLPVAAPGLRTAPAVPSPVMHVVPSSVQFPGAQIPAIPKAPMAPPSAMMPMTADAPVMDTGSQFVPVVVAPSEPSAFMRPLQGLLMGLAASIAIGVIMARKQINSGLQNSKSPNDVVGGLPFLNEAEESLELGMLPGRAGFPTMMAGEDYIGEETDITEKIESEATEKVAATPDPEPVTTPEPVAQQEPVAASEPVTTPEPAVEPAAVAEPPKATPAATPEPAAEPAAAAEPPKAPRSITWNPQGLKVPDVPKELELFSQQFVPAYLKESPAYLDGSMPGDIGFDPWALTVLANPTMKADALQALDKVSRTAQERDAKMLAMSSEEQQAKLAWMRDSELKHGRLAMLAAAGWPLAELNSGFALKFDTNGRAPSLFNGHLFDYLPFLVVAFGGLAYLEYTTKDSVKDGDFGFDPLGIASGKGPKGPDGTYIFDSIPEIPNVTDNVGNLDKLKLSEIKHGRAAMLAITGFAVQEFLWGNPVVEQTPFFFGK